MPSYNTTYYSNHSAEELFSIVADVKSYPQFLPWISSCRIHSKDDTQMVAELFIKFKAFRGSYTSKVILTPHSNIDASLIKGPFKYLTNNWEFQTCDDGRVKVTFNVDFQFKSRILGKMLDGIFASTTQKMIDAFEKRADKLF